MHARLSHALHDGSWLVDIAHRRVGLHSVRTRGHRPTLLSDLATLRSREPCADDKSRVRTMDAGLSRCDGRTGLLDNGERKGSEMR